MNERPTRWTGEAQVTYPLVTETALSPDGTRLAYVVREPLMTETESRFLTHLYLVPAAADEPSPPPLQLTWGHHSNHHPRWSPDGAYLAFLSDRGTRSDRRTNVYVMRVAGGEPWVLTAFEETDVVDLAWAPDGQQIAFLMAPPPSEDKVRARKAGDDAVVVGEDLDFCHLFTVPFVVAPRTLPDATQLTRGRFHVTQMAWLPDGARLALCYRPTPDEDAWTATRLATVPARCEADGEPYDLDTLTELATVAEWAPNPLPSPDGAWIAAVTGESPCRWAGANRVRLYAPDGSATRALAATPDAACWALGWSGDGSRVYVGETCGLDTHIWALDASGETATPVLTTPTYKGAMHMPAPLPGSAASTPDRIAFAEETFTQPNTLAIWEAAPSSGADAAVGADPAAGSTRSLGVPAWTAPADATASAVTALAVAPPLPEVEILRWQSPGFDPPIEGYVVLPLDYTADHPVPLVVDVHGGPTGVFQRRYLGVPDRYCDVLALAERGIAVLRVNPRGSGGYGRDFRFANDRDWGGGDYRDIMAGVDLLIDRGIADPERLGIMGWSYGGYMTSWAITQTDRFRAACVGAGVTNLMSFNGTADIPSFVPDYMGGEFWDDLETYRDHSALFQVAAATTPTLIQHGRADVRVPLSQGQELYNALKRRGVPVRMVVYPRQGHGFGEPRLLIDRRRRPVDWFAEWLFA